MPTNWHDDSKQLSDFAVCMEKAGVVESATDVISRPYRYTEQFEAWAECGFPFEDDESWDDWIKVVVSEEEAE